VVVVLCRHSSRGWAAFRRVARGVPFPSSRRRFYNIHPACTHVGTAIHPFSPASPLRVNVDEYCRRSRKREENVASLAFLSGMLPAFLCRRSIFDPLRSRGFAEGGISAAEGGLVYTPMVFRSVICVLAYEIYHKNEKSRQNVLHCDIDVRLFWMIKAQLYV